ncbi:MAG: DUF4446 family protein [bacterium]|nr:DUF4446 family protein [bacterium]
MQIVLIVLVLALLAITIYNQLQIIKLKQFFRRFFGNTQPRNIEYLLKKYSVDVDDALKKIDELAEFSAKLHKTSSVSLQKVGLIRFNPFDDTGGDQSFCLAALDSRNNGFILSSIHARSGTRVYTKEIVRGKSKHHLSEEEYLALKKAIIKDPLLVKKQKD